MAKRRKRQITITTDHIVSTLVYIRNLTDAMIAALVAGTGTAARSLPGPIYMDRAWAKDCVAPDADRAWAKDCPPPEVLKAWAKDCPPPQVERAWAKDCPPPEGEKAWAKDCPPPVREKAWAKDCPPPEGTVAGPRGALCRAIRPGTAVRILPPPIVRRARKR